MGRISSTVRKNDGNFKIDYYSNYIHMTENRKFEIIEYFHLTIVPITSTPGVIHSSFSCAP